MAKAGQVPPPPRQPTSPSPPAHSPGSRIDPNQIPRPAPEPAQEAVVFETRVNGIANVPPACGVNFIVRDTGNCSPRAMRCTVAQVPVSGDIMANSGIPLALVLRPLAPAAPGEEPVQVTTFGDSGPVRCTRCKAYVNPFFRFIDQGRSFVCNFCGTTSETPSVSYPSLVVAGTNPLEEWLNDMKELA